MMTESQVITTAFSEIVAGVSTELLDQLQAANSNIQQVGYLFGHPKEMVETLIQYDQSKTKRDKKYPLVMLIEDIPIRRGTQGYYGEAIVRIVIAMSTKATLKSAEREAANYAPILTPIYYELLRQIDLHSAFVTRGVRGIEHEMINRKYWGRENLYGTESNTLSDFVDAIEIRNMRLTVNFEACIPAINSYV